MFSPAVLGLRAVLGAPHSALPKRKAGHFQTCSIWQGYWTIRERYFLEAMRGGETDGGWGGVTWLTSHPHGVTGRCVRADVLPCHQVIVVINGLTGPSQRAPIQHQKADWPIAFS